MKRETLNLWLQFHEELNDAVPDHVVGFAKGWVHGWIMYELPKYKVGLIEVDEFHFVDGWDLNLVINHESLKIEVCAYPHIDDEDETEYCYWAKIVTKNLPLGKTTTNKGK